MIELQCHNRQNRLFIYLNIIGMIPAIEESKYVPIMALNIKVRLYSFNNVFVFIKQSIQVYCSNTFSLANDHSRVNWLSILKIKPRS